MTLNGVEIARLATPATNPMASSVGAPRRTGRVGEVIARLTVSRSGACEEVRRRAARAWRRV